MYERPVWSSHRSPTTRRSSRARVDRALWLAVAILFASAGTSPCSAATFSGTLAAAGVVWISDDSKPAALPETQMRNTQKSFVPDLVVITAGSSIRFPNDDPFFHSIYSTASPDPFDIGFYDTGPGKSVTFSTAGVVPVRCHIHGTMHATIVVVDGPWTQTHEPNQKYTLTDVRPGTHTLHQWSAESGEKTAAVHL